ncbi:metalloregulator ArsR/SmtB family transcription factor [Bacillus velezensis]|uniref:ArsR/SmtB family transcription factor n=1 Tax=Bacillus TaxID=1386 RepID=UPI0002A11EC8|nr:MULTISPECIES: metalloregulator ArsR/SmtB family transcription factor [Bacillus amyloliquefaciens group]AFZ89514.1 ArsR family transcriptional regulator [Bacillus velezensis AS43.3]MCP1565389.1 rhodanese-related sulfurtransferase/predicted transcriptional regulator [Bacillus velezensis]MEC1136346.1 metalloregulator ArsR/SmtB family transcription factor [Bacillus velezensis]MEC1701528.1 metalloregulator ArsR/SmtB family transcription factor [Bacillus velezensis]ODB67346.1 ArsR family transcri
MNERNLKDLLYQEFARIGKSLSSPKRLEILDVLTQGPKTVEALAKSTNMSIANVSQHLKTLFNSRMVNYKKEGNYVIYELADEIIADFLTSFHALSEKQLVEVQQIKQEFLNDKLGMEGVTLSELKERMEKGEVLLLDVRPAEEYEKAHIPGAISIPIQELENKLSSLPPNCEVVAYCRGPYCLMSAEAVEILRANGIHAFRLEEGVRDWKQITDLGD